MAIIIKIDEKDFNQRMNIALEMIKDDIVDSMMDKLTPKGGRDTGALASSIQLRSQVVNGQEIVFGMLDYGLNIEFGTPPHDVPPSELEGWIERKWLINWKPKGNNKKVHRQNAIKKLAQVLANHIREKGTRSQPFIRPTFNNEVGPIIKKRIIEAFKQ